MVTDSAEAQATSEWEGALANGSLDLSTTSGTVTRWSEALQKLEIQHELRRAGHDPLISDDRDVLTMGLIQAVSTVISAISERKMVYQAQLCELVGDCIRAAFWLKKCKPKEASDSEEQAAPPQHPLAQAASAPAATVSSQRDWDAPCVAHLNRYEVLSMDDSEYDELLTMGADQPQQLAPPTPGDEDAPAEEQEDSEAEEPAGHSTAG